MCEIINGKEYKLITIHNRSKLIARDGSALNPYRRNQKVGIHYNPDGYPCFGGGIPVHLYVAHAWVDGWFEGAEVNHIDLDRCNYNANNLEWVTHHENVIHSALQKKYSRFGTENPRARSIRITKNKEELQFDTVLDCCRYFKQSLNLKSSLDGIRSGIDRALKQNHPYRGWDIQKM